MSLLNSDIFKSIMNNPQRQPLLSGTHLSLNPEGGCIIIHPLAFPSTLAGFPQRPGPVP